MDAQTSDLQTLESQAVGHDLQQPQPADFEDAQTGAAHMGWADLRRAICRVHLAHANMMADFAAQTFVVAIWRTRC